MSRIALSISNPNKPQVVRYLPEGEVVLGRHPICDIILPEEQISRQHAKLILRNGEILLEDLGSNNGTYVNGKLISRHMLSPSDLFSIGTFVLQIRYPTEEEHRSQPDLSSSRAITSSQARSVSINQTTAPNISLKQVTEETVRASTSRTLSEHDNISASVRSIRTLGQIEHFQSAPRRSRDEQRQEELRWASLLSQFSKLCSQAPGELASDTVEVLYNALQAETILFLKGQFIDEIRALAVQHFAPLDEHELPASTRVIREVIQTKTSLLQSDVRQREDLASESNVFLYDIASVIAVPILWRESLLGVLYLNRRHRPFEETELAFVETISHIVALSVSLLNTRSRISEVAVAAPAPTPSPTPPSVSNELVCQTEAGTILQVSLREVEPFLSRLGTARTTELLSFWKDLLGEASQGEGVVWSGLDGLSSKIFFSHAERALYAALGLRQRFADWNTKHLPRLRIRPSFGLHTAPCYVCTWGRNGSKQQTVFGEAVEGAVALETAAAFGEIIASQTCIRGLERAFAVSSIDPARLAGVAEELSTAVAVFGKKELV